MARISFMKISSDRLKKSIELCRHEESEIIVEILDLLGKVSLAKKIASDLNVYDLLRQGLPSLTIRSLLRNTGFSIKELSVGISMSESRLKRLMVDPAHARALSAMESGIIWQFSEMYVRTVNGVGSNIYAREWLFSERKAFGYRRPIDLVSLPIGAAILRRFFGQMANGVFI